MSEIEKMYENANIEKEVIKGCYDYYSKLGIDIWKENDCKNKDCNTCKADKSIKEYPPFTAEKQLSLFQWVCKKFGEIYISYTDFKEVKSWEIVYKISVHRDSFEECLCAFINLFWQSLTSEEKQQIKEILNG